MSRIRRIGLVEIGSNAIRSEITEHDGSQVTILHAARASIRLGDGSFGAGALLTDAIERTVATLVDFRALCDAQGVESITAIATAALREADDAQPLIDRVMAATGISIRVISGTEEAQLLRRAVTAKIGALPADSLLVDVGGGSVELIRADDSSLPTSLPLGAVRLLRQLTREHQTSIGTELLAAIRALIAPFEPAIRAAAPPRAGAYFATGGNIASLAELMPPHGLHPTRFGVDACDLGALSILLDELAAIDLAARIEGFALAPDRADTIVPAGLVYCRIAEIAGVDRIIVPRTGTRAGLRATVLALP